LVGWSTIAQRDDLHSAEFVKRILVLILEDANRGQVHGGLPESGLGSRHGGGRLLKRRDGVLLQRRGLGLLCGLEADAPLVLSIPGTRAPVETRGDILVLDHDDGLVLGGGLGLGGLGLGGGIDIVIAQRPTQLADGGFVLFHGAISDGLVEVRGGGHALVVVDS